MEQNAEIGLALAGGGLQGFSHIGVLKALEELGIKIKYISGTSTGSIAASLYAAGLTPEEIENVCKVEYKNILKLNKRKLAKIALNYLRFNETKIEGLIDGIVIENLINNQVVLKNISDISEVKNKKLAIATVDTKSMKECIFISEDFKNKDKNVNYIRNINVGKAVRASMAFPGIFTTVNHENYNFIDGGTVDNLPTKVLKDMGAEKVISVSFDLNNYKPSESLEGVILRALDIFSSKDVRKGQEQADIAIEITNNDTSLVKIKELDTTIKNGYDAVMKYKDELLKI